MRRIIFFFAVVFALTLPFITPGTAGLYAADHGILLNMELDVDGADETHTRGTIIIAPWISFAFESSELYISAGLNTSISKDNYFAPELFRLEYSSWKHDKLSFRFGRITWQDPSRLIAKGRFDGADLRYSTGKINLGFNLLYTGLLFKDTAYINVSPTDKDYSENFDWSDFANTYFAPRRLLTSLYGEFPGFPRGRGLFYASLLAQFDLSGASEKYHTQYLLLRHVLVYEAFDLTLSGAAAFAPSAERATASKGSPPGNTEANGIKPAFAFSINGGWQTPSSIEDRLSLGIAWASGKGASTAAFFPITREAMSLILKPAFSGIMIIRLDYIASLKPSLTAELGALYFIRADSTSFIAPYLRSDSYPLGLELNTGLVWVPFSDLAFTINGGIFFPSSAWADDAPFLWRLTLGTTFSF